MAGPEDSDRNAEQRPPGTSVYEALDRFECIDDPSGTEISTLVVTANPILVNGEVLAEETRLSRLENEVGVELGLLAGLFRDALQERYGETLADRDRELIVSGVTLTVMALRRYSILDGIPPQARHDADIETPST